MNKDIKEFYEWYKENGLSDTDEHFITDVTMTLSTVKYKDNLPEERMRNNVPKMWERCQNDWTDARLPDYADITEITFSTYKSIIKSGVKKDFSIEELLYSLYKQGLCAPLALDLLKTAHTRLAEQMIENHSNR
ncbi:hypothetical protein HOO54_07030 [Bacillus sp. WMMC1349]|uniref:hypothetical protein n=1 Tax=Bacillus sp. WMMC1349 TaxID=2736254 RepID=UPI0015556AAA|nr:hypothetical protein [Bacillus sp. WMMC1349]NPC91971.1 hypothetical protein [Bacillus sp. WMMC1349]